MWSLLAVGLNTQTVRSGGGQPHYINVDGSTWNLRATGQSITITLTVFVAAALNNPTSSQANLGDIFEATRRLETNAQEVTSM